MVSRLIGGLFSKTRDTFQNGFYTLYNINSYCAQSVNYCDEQQYNVQEKKIIFEQKQSQSDRETKLKVSMLPFICIISEKLNDVKCLFGESKIQRNKVKNRVAHLQYPANNPIEDRLAINQLNNIDGYFLSVFDGHGGWQVADFAKNTLSEDFDIILKNNLKNASVADFDQIIKQSLIEAYDSVENKFLQMANQAYNMGFSQTARVGACSLSVLINNNKLYAANSGDCKGVICSGDYKSISCKKINNKFNANSKKEQKRLRDLFPKEQDIIVCRKGNAGPCYVKNMLQPTRSFGDFRLKYKQFNNPKQFDYEQGFPFPIKTFTGPYITHQPDIKTFDLDKQDKYLILASDGLWDELNNEQVAMVVQQNMGDKVKIAQALFDKALEKAAKDASKQIFIKEMTISEIKQLQIGSRRNYHDDITILVVDLQNQVY